MGYTKGDYHIDSVGATEKKYSIGNNSGELFVSNETTILTNIECQIKINDDIFWQPVPPYDYFISHRNITTITYKSSQEGKIEIWAEGSHNV